MQKLFDSPQFKNLCKQNGIIYLGLFGSHARGEEHDNSDIDLLVEYSDPVGYLTHAKVENMLADFLKKPVDVALRRRIQARIRHDVMMDVNKNEEKIKYM